MRRKLRMISSFYLVLCLLVSGKHANAIAPKSTNLMVTTSNVKTTSVTIRALAPTKAIILNVSAKPEEPMKENFQLSSEQSQILNKTNQNNSEEASIEPLNSNKGEILKPESLPKESKGIQVTGFLTKNGNIYEIEDKDGFGLIEGRQSSVDEKINVCNYGNVVIYSDVPCEEVTNVHVGNIAQTTHKHDKDQQGQIQNQSLNPKEGQLAEQQQLPEQQQQQQQQQSQNNFDEEPNDVGEVQPPRHKNGQKRRRVQQYNQTRRRKNKNGNKQKISAHRNQQKRRRQQSPQKPRKRQQNRRRLQNQQNSTQRRQHKNRNRKRNRNRVQQRPYRRHRNDATLPRGGGNTNRNRRRNQRLSQTSQRQQEYDTQHFDDYDYDI